MDKPQNRFLSVTYQLYTVTDGEKSLEEQTGADRPFEFITGYGIALDAFEKNLIGLEKGKTFDFTLQPNEAFGEYIPEGMHKLERDIFSINGKFDHEHIFEGAIITNHPLAGKELNFVGEVKENRVATEEEIQHLIKMLTGGCQGCGHHGNNCGEDCGDGCGNHEGGCGHCH